MNALAQSLLDNTMVGIDRLAFYTPQYYVDLSALAEQQGLAADHYQRSIGQQRMGIAPPDEDIVSMATSAAAQVLHDQSLDDIEILLFATETGIDQSKAAGIYVHQLLGLPARCRVMELKQACYSATGALRLAMPYLRLFSDKKVLLIASDIARYELNTPAEPSRGAGAVAMLLSGDPRLISFEPYSGLYTEDVMDFWRPNYQQTAFVEGKHSCDVYIRALSETWAQYQAETARSLTDHVQFCYHVPVPRLVEKAHKRLVKKNKLSLDDSAILAHIADGLRYSREIGNCYTASLYLSIASLFDHYRGDLSQQRIGCYSYGSGCVGEFFSGMVQPNYQQHLNTDFHQSQLAAREALSYADYSDFARYQLPQDGSSHLISKYRTGRARFTGVAEHKRQYSIISP